MKKETAIFRHSGLAFSSRQEIEAVQSELLSRHVSYLANNSPFYRKRFQRYGINPAEIRSIADLDRLPLTNEGELAACNEDFLCVGSQDVVDLCLVSESTEKPAFLAQTARDLERLGYSLDLSFRGAGIAAEDRVLTTVSMDRCSMAGLGIFLGLNRIGAQVIRGAGSDLPALAEQVAYCRPTSLIGPPTLLLALAEKLMTDGVEPAGLGVRELICVDETPRRADLSLSPSGHRLQTVYGAAIFAIYLNAATATSFSDCFFGRGGHLQPELIIVEIVDEEGRGLPPGVTGEVVATPLQVTGMPLLRYRTGDMASLHIEPCSCGRNTVRLGPVPKLRAQTGEAQSRSFYCVY